MATLPAGSGRFMDSLRTRVVWEGAVGLAAEEAAVIAASVLRGEGVGADRRRAAGGGRRWVVVGRVPRRVVWRPVPRVWVVAAGDGERARVRIRTGTGRATLAFAIALPTWCALVAAVMLTAAATGPGRSGVGHALGALALGVWAAGLMGLGLAAMHAINRRDFERVEAAGYAVGRVLAQAGTPHPGPLPQGEREGGG